MGGRRALGRLDQSRRGPGPANQDGPAAPKLGGGAVDRLQNRSVDNGLVG